MSAASDAEQLGSVQAVWLCAWRLAMVVAMYALPVCAVLSIACTSSGCMRVAPYQRETLARRDMAIAEDPALTAGEEHGREYREGSRGGGSSGGGGCGCN